MIRNLLAFTGLLAIALVAAVTLQAQGYFDDFRIEDEPPLREAVSFEGLDLSSAAGVALLEDRVNAAIDRVCPDDRTKSLKRNQAIRDCRADAVASVRPQIDRAVAEAEERRAWAAAGPRRWHGYADAERYDDRGPPRPRYRPTPPPPPIDYRPAPRPVEAAPPPPPPPGARLVRRTTTTTVTTTTDRGGSAIDRSDERTVVEKFTRPPAARSKPAIASERRSPAYARRPAVAHSWLPPSAWAAIDRATIRAFRTGRLTRWSLTDRDGIARAGYVSVSPVRWVGGCPCRNVQVVKYVGGRQLVVAGGMKCQVEGRLVPRAR